MVFYTIIVFGSWIAMLSISSDDFLLLLKGSLSINVNDFAALKVYRDYGDPFSVLVTTILTQNTSDKNAIKAFDVLSRKFKIKPEVFASISLDEIIEAIKSSGMYYRKSRTIKLISEAILRKFNGDFNSIFRLPLKDAREALLALPGIGRKTADVLLLMCGKMPTFPVDRHVERVSKRIGFVSMNATYEEIRSTLMNFFRPENYLEAHLLLIALGRKYCKAKKPLCFECPIKNLCNYGLSGVGG